VSKFIRTTLTAAALAAALGALVTPALAQETQWQKDHPRRTEVNSRLNNQNRRIHNEVKSGQINKAQAAQLHHEDHNIRREERAMASTNNGHITKTEQRALNQQENQVSGQIGK
jgi:hypothetical protein